MCEGTQEINRIPRMRGTYAAQICICNHWTPAVIKPDVPQPQGDIAERMAQECLAVRVRLLNRTLTAIYDEALRPLGMTTGQLNVLVVVAKRGSVSPATVAQRLHMEKSTVSRNIERMRAHGWLIVSPNKSGRGQVLAIHAKGRKLLERALPLWNQAQERSQALLGQLSAESLRRAADAVWARAGSG